MLPRSVMANLDGQLGIPGKVPSTAELPSQAWPAGISMELSLLLVYT